MGNQPAHFLELSEGELRDYFQGKYGHEADFGMEMKKALVGSANKKDLRRFTILVQGLRGWALGRREEGDPLFPFVIAVTVEVLTQPRFFRTWWDLVWEVGKEDVMPDYVNTTLKLLIEQGDKANREVMDYMAPRAADFTNNFPRGYQVTRNLLEDLIFSNMSVETFTYLLSQHRGWFLVGGGRANAVSARLDAEIQEQGETAPHLDFAFLLLEQRRGLFERYPRLKEFLMRDRQQRAKSERRQLFPGEERCEVCKKRKL